jgi:hypothetical protein
VNASADKRWRDTRAPNVQKVDFHPSSSEHEKSFKLPERFKQNSKKDRSSRDDS